MSEFERIEAAVLGLSEDDFSALRDRLHEEGVFFREILPRSALHFCHHGFRTDEFRRLASQDPELAYRYAIAEGKPHEVTRAGACLDAEKALQYAKRIDKGPHDDTRKACCGNAHDAMGYLLHVDKCYHEDTWAVVKGTSSEELYRLTCLPSVRPVPEGA